MKDGQFRAKMRNADPNILLDLCVDISKQKMSQTLLVNIQRIDGGQTTWT